MIISASRRTDIPAFYTDWFLEGIKNGYIEYPNPMYPDKTVRVKLTPTDVDLFVFWTKNPKPLLERIDELKDYKYYFQYTLNSYPQVFEPNIPSYIDRVNTLIQLSSKIGKDKVIWRYDPIFMVIYQGVGVDFHIRSFKETLTLIHNHISRIVISFIDVYGKITTTCKQLGIRPPTLDEIKHIVECMASIADEYDLKIYTCAEAYDLSQYNIQKGSCIDSGMIFDMTGKCFNKKDKGQRAQCGCVESKDIGMYGTCKHNCAYCYAK